MDALAQAPGKLTLLSREDTTVSKRFLVQTRVDGHFLSNAINNGFLQKIFLGGYISEEMKSSVYDDLEQKNLSFATAGLDLEFFNLADTLFKERDWGLKLNLGLRFDAQAEFTSDLFRLSFSGNRDFRGRTAEFDESSAQYLVYQKLGVGLFHKKTFSGVSLSFVNGQELLRSEIDDASLFTSMSGDSLVLDYQGQTWSSDSTKRGFASGNGVGAALDLHWNLPMTDGKGFVLLSLEDFGFIQWSDRTRKFSADTSYTFNGIDLEAILDNDLPFQIVDLQDSLGIVETTSAHTTWLPARLNLGLLRTLNSNWYYEVAIRARVSDLIFPELSVGAMYMIENKLLAGARISYSVYGTLATELNLEWMPGKKWLIHAKSSNLSGVVSEDIRTFGGQIGLSKFF